MHIQCLICYCFYPTGWNSKGKNSELSVSLSSSAFSSLFSSSPSPSLSHFHTAGHPNANCTLTNTKYSEHIFSLACTFVNLFSQLDSLNRYVCPGELGPFCCCGQASVGNSFCPLVTGSWVDLCWTGDWWSHTFPPDLHPPWWVMLSLSLMFQVAGLLPGGCEGRSEEAMRGEGEKIIYISMCSLCPLVSWAWEFPSRRLSPWHPKCVGCDSSGRTTEEWLVVWRSNIVPRRQESELDLESNPSSALCGLSCVVLTKFLTSLIFKCFICKTKLLMTLCVAVRRITWDNVYGGPSQVSGRLLVLKNCVLLFQVPYLSLHFPFLSVLLYFTVRYREMWNMLHFQRNYSVLSISFPINFLAISKCWSKFHHLSPPLPLLISGKGDWPKAYIEFNEKLNIFLILNSWKHHRISSLQNSLFQILFFPSGEHWNKTSWLVKLHVKIFNLLT